MNKEQFENGVVEVVNTAHMNGEASVYGFETAEVMSQRIAEDKSDLFRYRAANKVLSFFGIKKPLEQVITGPSSGRLYPALAKLEGLGILQSHWQKVTEAPNARRRRLYQLAVSPDEEPVASMLDE
ncbi:MAG TPA: helix-turn-helix transcriptional regulator [Candidatus Saccharimonadales bacterium]|nr:helix-turn-helix transcriptional regulator [Candidatus Saccharimonadales bacterium]